MTKESLQLGQDIQDRISNLKGALHEISNTKLFSCSERNICTGYKSDSFLSELHVSIQKEAIDAINAKVIELELQFSKI